MQESAPTRDHDVFGDGSVTIVSTPGHTPGHQSFLVPAAQDGRRRADRRRELHFQDNDKAQSEGLRYVPAAYE